MKHNLALLTALLATCSSLLFAAETKVSPDPQAAGGFTWPFEVPADCPFPRSTSLTGIHFTGKHSDIITIPITHK